jgi:predicted component of type VI protein secretion system
MSDVPTDNSPPRRRALSPHIVTGRAARHLVEPLAERLGALQAEIVKVEAMAQRGQSNGRVDPWLVSSAQLLSEAARRERLAFEDILADLPDAVRLHSQVSDARRVLRMIEERVAATLATIGVP